MVVLIAPFALISRKTSLWLCLSYAEAAAAVAAVAAKEGRRIESRGKEYKVKL